MVSTYRSILLSPSAMNASKFGPCIRIQNTANCTVIDAATRRRSQFRWKIRFAQIVGPLLIGRDKVFIPIPGHVHTGYQVVTDDAGALRSMTICGARATYLDRVARPGKARPVMVGSSLPPVRSKAIITEVTSVWETRAPRWVRTRPAGSSRLKTRKGRAVTRASRAER